MVTRTNRLISSTLDLVYPIDDSQIPDASAIRIWITSQWTGNQGRSRVCANQLKAVVQSTSHVGVNSLKVTSRPSGEPDLLHRFS